MPQPTLDSSDPADPLPTRIIRRVRSGSEEAISLAAIDLWVSMLAALLVLTAPLASAQPGTDDAADEPARPKLIAETRGLVAGATNNIAVTFDIDEGWHVYWPGQNDTGFAPSIDLTLPEGWTAGDTQWPAPHRYISPGGILDHVYEDGEATFIIPVTIPADAQTGPAEIAADLEWLVCREACIPGWTTVTLEARVLPAGSRVRPGVEADRFEKARRRHPLPLKRSDAHPEADELGGEPWASLAWDAGTLRITPRSIPGLDPAKGPASIAFYPDAGSAPIEDLLEQGERVAKENGKPDAAPRPLTLTRSDPSKPVSGIVEVRFRGNTRPALYRIETRPPGETEPGGDDTPTPGSGTSGDADS